MNNLSWFLYTAEILANVQGLLIFAGILFTAIFGIMCVVNAFHNSDNNDERPYPNLKYLSIPMLMWLVAAGIPSQRTMYLILASEVSESVATTPEAKKIMNDVYEIVQQQLNKMKEPQ